MRQEDRPLGEIIREFFQYHPDYAFCRTLAMNIKEGTATYGGAVEILTRKARASEQSREEIQEKLDRRTVEIGGRLARIKDLSLREAMRQDDRVLTQIVEFYFKHPYAHGRIKKTRLVPRWIRTFFLSVLVGHARRRGLDLEYGEYFEMLQLL